MTRLSFNHQRANAKHVGRRSVAVKPFRDRAVPFRIVVCPECKADIGDPCVSTAGAVRTNPHACRRRMAIRATWGDDKEGETG